MHDIISLKDRVTRILLSERTMLNIILGVLSALLAIGLLNNTADTSTLVTLQQLAPLNLWAAAFITYSFFKIQGCLYRTPISIKLINSLWGLWLWSYVILSQALFAFSHIQPTGFLLFATILFELWALVVIMFHYVHPNSRRLHDATN